MTNAILDLDESIEETINIEEVEFLSILKSRDETTTHTPFTVGDSAFSGEGGEFVFGFGGNSYRLSDYSFRQLCGLVDIPVPFASKISTTLLAHNINSLLSERGVGTGAVLLDEENEAVRAFIDPRYPYVATHKILDKIIETIDGPYTIKYANINDVQVSAVILPDELQETIVDSKVFGGIKFAHSDSWNIPTKFETFLFRELCSNGMTTGIDSRKFRVSGASEDQILRQVEEYTRLALDQIPKMIEGFQNSAEESVADVNKLIERFCVEYNLPSKVKERLIYWSTNPIFLETIPNNSVKTMYDFINLLTFVGSHDTTLSQEHRDLLLSIGGGTAISHDERCGQCGTLV